MRPEDPLRVRLLDLADSIEPVDLTDRVLAAGRRRRRRRSAVAVAASMSGVAAVVAGTLVVTGGGTAPGPAPALTASPSATPTGPAGRLDAAFRVAAPQVVAMSGPAPQQQRPCRPANITSSGELRATANGVAGVVSLRGNHCSLHIYPGPDQLLDARGQPLAMPVDTHRPKVNPPANGRPDLSLGAGVADWGFLWRGSWCGAPAASVVVPLGYDPSDLVLHAPLGHVVVAVRGPSLPCAGRSDSTLVPGVPGDGGQGVLPVPAEWERLRLQVTMPARAAYATDIDGVVVTVSNPTAAPVALAPCATVTVVASDRTAFGSESGVGVAPLPCAAVVPAHGRLRIALPTQHYGVGAPPGQEPPSGTTVTVTVALAGVPSASATTRVA